MGHIVTSPHVTIRNVADVANVSTATVSRVLSGLPGASEETRQRVLKTARELGYQGDPNATALRLRKSNTIGIIVPDIVNPFFTALIHELETCAQQSGKDLFIANSQNDVIIERQRVQTLANRRVDALLISPVHRTMSSSTIQWAHSRIPVIQIDRHAGHIAPYVGADQNYAMNKALEHVTGTGCSRVAYIGYPESTSSSKERIDAFNTYISRHTSISSHIETGLPPHAAQQIADWIEFGECKDAIIASSDLHAIAVKLELQRRGINIPSDVVLMSFDNTSLADAANITSFQQPIDLIARKSIELVEDSDSTGEVIFLAGRIVIRGSSQRES
ncbi:LacI family DNA-binding transcriptional regulator [Nesterenkonia ebinurensis]|uniref:LacI family DNA-binding transcriptional regulator n=1 Tax=Nesterenkonia ebinurensis TaxID=2608252 RepID=UPI00123C83B9|nr:LacI family DNA-binding transcriptional regulator [Nesterenkonia ebinurensis]